MRGGSAWAAAVFGAGLLVSSAAAETPRQGSACGATPNATERLRCHEQSPSFDFASVVLRELECDAPPRAAEIIRLLIRRNAVSSLAFHMADGINYFALPRPETIDGLTIVAVFAHDESGRFPFLRARGASPGAVFGVVTRDELAAIDAWRLRHSPALLSDESQSSMQGARDIGCFALPRSEQQTASPPASPAGSSGRPDDLFEAGLAPKRR